MASYRKNLIWPGSLCGLLLLALLAWRLVSPKNPSIVQVGPPPLAPTLKPIFTPDEMQAMQAGLAALTNAPDAKISRLTLEGLRAKLAAMPKAEAVALICKFLDGKTDAATRLGFKVTSNGLLSEAPTFRTFLLDELARLDPAAAADYAKIILASMDSPDEWAVALRNLLRGDSSSDASALAKTKFMQMLVYADWQRSPSIGYLEAFDVAVQLGDPDFVPPMTGLLTATNNPAVAHAAYLSLDRMVINNPVQTLTALATDPSAMAGRELVRADYFARLDVRDPRQEALLENYLLSPQLSPAELQQFIGVFPNANFMISPNLLTANNTLSHAALTGRDAASFQVLNQWLADPRFAQLHSHLETAQQRVAGFVSQEGGHP